MLKLRHLHCALGFLVLLCFVAQGAAAQDTQSTQVDLTGLTLEQLLTVEVSSASKYSQPSSEAPSAVQVISREEIQLHGWRTLSEALSSLPGIYINNDRVYDFPGARGFQIPGDYNTRFLLLIDGLRNNDNIYQQALTGSEGWLDMSVVERIEYIPGPGSAIYGSNAMFGVINVITRRAGNTSQSQVGTYASQLGLTGVNVMTSQTIAGNDTGLLLQYSTEHQAGRDQTYSDPAGNLFRADGSPATDGVAHGLDSGNNRHLMMRLDHDELSFKLINNERTITPSSAPYLTVFDDGSLKINDGGTQLSASVQHEFSGSSSVYALLGYTDWHYRATYPYLDPVIGYLHNYDDSRGQILNGEFRYRLESGAHHLLTGLEFSRDLLARQHNYYSVDPATLGTANVYINQLDNYYALFIQDGWQISHAWLLSMGLRLDQATGSASNRSPRLGLIWHPNSAWTAKLLTGRAYRPPNDYESHFGDGVNYLSNPGLQTETIRTNEGVVEWLSSEQTRWQLSLYENRLNNLIQQVDTGAGLQYQNHGWVRVYGAELGVEKITASSMKLRASISGNNARNDMGTDQENSPEWTAKTSVIAPVFDHSAYLAAEAQAIGRRSYTWSAASYHVGTEVLANTTLTFPNVWAKGLQAQLRITNLFNRTVRHPASAEMPTPMVPQDGRNLLAKLEYAF
jgi:outer membrane receptor protein involved in Fe transport